MKTWKILNTLPSSDYSPQKVVEALLENRKVTDTSDFLNPEINDVTLEAVGIDKGEVDKTINLIKKAINEKKTIVIYGDYDVDGICGAAILWETLYTFYKKVIPYIPHRIEEGYGLSVKGIDSCINQSADLGLIITVDNGIVASKAVLYAKEKGIDVVVTDHHTKGSKLPEAAAIVHTTELCGAGVSYLLSQTLAVSFGVAPNENHLELAALATVADLVPLNRFNRKILKFGLEKLRNTTRLGLIALLEEAKVDIKALDTYHIGHIIAPRLNASGRITHALDSLRLICTKDEKKARELARQLGQVNSERQVLTKDSAEHAKGKVEKESLPSLIFVEDPTYEQGVIGLIASRLVEEFYRPSVAVSIGDKVSKGSARSIPGVNIIELIRSVPELVSEAGGHPMAAGFSIKTEKLKEFKKELVNKADKIISAKTFERILAIDLELPFEHINIELFNAIQSLAPFGMGNSQPIFLAKGVKVASLNFVGRERQHIQLLLEKDGDFFKAMKFAPHTLDINIGSVIDIAYSLDINEWNGNRKIELKIKDIKHIEIN